MATATLEFDCPEGGTFTAELYARGADTLINTGGSACTERTNDKGCYTASIVDIASGTYKLRIRNAANVTIARGLLEHTNSAVVESPSAVDWDNIVAPTATVQLSGTTMGAVSASGANEIADAVLSRSVSNVEATADEHSLCTIILAGLESSRSGTTWTIKRTDGVTTHVVKTLTQSSDAILIIGVS